MALSNATELADWGSGIGTGPLQVDNVNKRIGIGTTVPLAQTDIFNQTGVTTTLLVRQVGDYDILRLEDEATPDVSPALLVKADGKIGIGTVNPSYKLQVETVDSAALARFKRTDAGAALFQIMSQDGGSITFGLGDVSDPDIQYIKSDNSDNSLSFGTNAGEKLHITSAGLVGVGTNNPKKTLNVFAGAGTTELIRLSQPVTPSLQQDFGIGWCSNNDHLWPGAQITSREFDVSDPRRDLRFYTRVTNDDVAPVERMCIQYNGYVGMGTTAADRPLHVYDDSNSIVFVESADTNADIIQADTDGSTRVRSGSGRLLIYTHGDASSSTAANSQQAVRINQDGQVGLGSHTPAVKLDIREIKEGGDVQIRVYNLDNASTTTQTSSINLSPDSRALAGTGLKAIKETADFTTSADRDVSMAFNVLLNNSQTERMRLDSVGRLLVGITSPMSTGSNDGRDTIQAVHTAGAQLLLARNDTSAAITNRIGEIAALGNDSDGTYEPCASIRFEVENTHSTDDKSTAIIFKTCKDGTDDLYERIRISNFGGIGLAGHGHVGAASTDFGRDNQVLASDGSATGVQWRYVNTPCWFGSQDTQHTIATGTWTDIINLGNTVTNVDCHGGWDESTGTFTVPADSGGIYYLFGQAGIDDVQDADVVRAGISINGANPSFFAQQQCIDQGTNVVVPSGLTSRVADLSAGDTVNLMVYHNEGTSEVTEPNRTFFGGYRLSAHP